jgi:hypothetical protein
VQQLTTFALFGLLVLVVCLLRPGAAASSWGSSSWSWR